MKAISFTSFCLFAGLSLTVIACNNGNGSSESDSTLGNSFGDSVGSEMENVASGIKGDLAVNTDSSFLSKAITGNQEEMILIQSGIEKGTNTQLKTDARKMLADHNKLKTQLMDYAKQKGYSFPATDEGKSSDDLSDLNKNAKGPEWDKAWADKMVDEHKDDIDAFETGEQSVKDSALHAIITNTLPVLRSHLSKAEDLQKIISMKEKG